MALCSRSLWWFLFGLLLLGAGATSFAGERRCPKILYELSRGSDKLALFDLESLGIDREQFLAQVRPSFAELEPDLYLVKKRQLDFLLQAYQADPAVRNRLRLFQDTYWSGEGDLSQVRDLIDQLDPTAAREFADLAKPTRFRKMAKYSIEKGSRGSSVITEIDESAFSQDKLVDDLDIRKKKRVFGRSAEAFRKHPMIRLLLHRVFEMVQEATGGSVRKVEIALHQMSIVASDGRTATNSPEGVHQDGMDFIVSALVIERTNIKGGQSIVFGSDKSSKILSIELQDGQGIFQSDHGSNLYHVATRIEQADKSKPAVRNIIGLDITIQEKEPEMTNVELEIQQLPGRWAIAQLPPDFEIPAWALQGSYSIDRNPEELSIVCPQTQVPAGVKSEGGWVRLKIKGPLALSAVGILVSVLRPLADAGIAQYSTATYNTDYLMIKEENLTKAIQALEAAGHHLL